MNLQPYPGMRFKLSPTAIRKAYVLVFATLAASLGQFAILVNGIRINATDSMPRGIYHLRASSRHAMRDDTVAVWPPLRAASLGRERGYIGVGSCPGNVEPLLKIVAAVGGDEVAMSSGGIAVNGRLLPESARLRSDSAGRPIAYWSSARYTILPGMIFLYSPSRRSWDSRYFGPIPEKNVEGRAVPLLLERVGAASPGRP